MQRLADLGHRPEEQVVLAQGVVPHSGAEGNGDDLHDPARSRGHHHHPVGEEHGLGDRVGDEHDGGLGLGADPDQLVLHPLPGHLVQRPERLVHQQQSRPLGQGAGDRHPLLHAAGQLVGIGAGELAQPDQLDQLAHPGLGVRPCRRRAA